MKVLDLFSRSTNSRNAWKGNYEMHIATAIVTIRRGALHKNGQKWSAEDEEHNKIVTDVFDPERAIVEYYKSIKFRGVILTKWRGANNPAMVFDLRKKDADFSGRKDPNRGSSKDLQGSRVDWGPTRSSLEFARVYEEGRKAAGKATGFGSRPHRAK